MVFHLGSLKTSKSLGTLRSLRIDIEIYRTTGVFNEVLDSFVYDSEVLGSMILRISIAKSSWL